MSNRNNDSNLVSNVALETTNDLGESANAESSSSSSKETICDESTRENEGCTELSEKTNVTSRDTHHQETRDGEPTSKRHKSAVENQESEKNTSESNQQQTNASDFWQNDVQARSMHTGSGNINNTYYTKESAPKKTSTPRVKVQFGKKNRTPKQQKPFLARTEKLIMQSKKNKTNTLKNSFKEFLEDVESKKLKLPLDQHQRNESYQKIITLTDLVKNKCEEEDLYDLVLNLHQLQFVCIQQFYERVTKLDKIIQLANQLQHTTKAMLYLKKESDFEKIISLWEELQEEILMSSGVTDLKEKLEKFALFLMCYGECLSIMGDISHSLANFHQAINFIKLAYSEEMKTSSVFLLCSFRIAATYFQMKDCKKASKWLRHCEDNVSDRCKSKASTNVERESESADQTEQFIREVKTMRLQLNQHL